MSPNYVSIRPSDFVEGGAVPVDRNLLITQSRWVIWDYQGKAPPTVALKVEYRDDDGQEYTQYYSAGDPARYQPSDDGKNLVAVVSTASNLARSSNFAVFQSNLVSAGFPENKIVDAASIENLYAYYIGVPEPKRSGLKRDPLPDGAVAREKVILAVNKILRLPWEKTTRTGAAAKPAAKTAAKPAAAQPVQEETETETEAGDGGDVTAEAVEFIKGMLDAAGGGPVTRQQAATKVFQTLGDNPNRDAIATTIFSPEFGAALLGAGLKIKGDNITR